MEEQLGPDHSVARSRVVVPAALGVAMVAAIGLAGCGTTDEASRQTLPPIRTTIASTTSTSTSLPEGQRFYTVKTGDTLGRIAESLGVPINAIVELNGLASPDAIQAGQTLEIPSGNYVIITDLPEGPGTSAP